MISTYLQNAKLRATADELKQVLQLARSEAIKPNDIVKFTGLNGGDWIVAVYSNDLLTSLATKPSAAGSHAAVIANNSVIRFDGSGRPDVAATL